MSRGLIASGSESLPLRHFHRTPSSDRRWNRIADAGLADNQYRLSVQSNASATGIDIVTASGNTLGGTAANGNAISADLTSTRTQGTVFHESGTTTIDPSHNCAP